MNDDQEIWDALRRLTVLTHDLKWNGYLRYQRMYEDLGILIMGVLRPSQETDKILAGIQQLKEGLQKMSAETDAAVAKLTAQIATLKTAEDAAVVLINSIPGLMSSAGVPAAQIDAVTASLATNAQPLLDAIAAVGTQPAPPGPVIVSPPAT